MEKPETSTIQWVPDELVRTLGKEHVEKLGVPVAGTTVLLTAVASTVAI